jgi:site-specific DNA recombinase
VATERGYDLPAEFIFIDDGYSGARVDRPALDRLRDRVSEGAIEIVLVGAPDRLARHYAYQVVVLEEFKRAGCEVIFLNHAFGQSPEEQMLLQIQGVFAEYERALLHERTRRGRLFAARQGRVNWGGNPPYGYRYIRKTDTTPQRLEVCEAEAAIVQQMYRWLVEEGLSSYAIQRRLLEEGVPTRKAHTQGWAQSTVIDILRSPLYKGEARYNRTQIADVHRPHGARGFKDLRPGNGRGRAVRPAAEWISVRVPAIVDSEVWDMAQTQLAFNRERATRHNTQHTYLLRGLLVCGRCGRRLVGVWARIGGRYICSARYPRHTPWTCDGRSLSAVQAETVVWEHVRTLLSNSELLRAQYRDGHGDPAVDVREEQEHARLERKLGALEREVQRLIDAYQAEVIELPELQTRHQRVEDHSRVLRQRLRELDDHHHSRQQQLRMVQGLEEFCTSMRAALREPSFEIKQKVLQLVVDRVIVDDQQLTIRHVIPTGPVRLQTGSQPSENLR